jgi:nucleoside-diphosphate-sugar epimerase
LEKPLILLTGATGFIGGHLLRPLASLARVRCLVRRQPRSPIECPGVVTVAGDLAEPDSLAAACRGVDTIIHLGAMLRTGDEDLIEKVNVGGTRSLVDEALLSGVKYFVYLSTENALRHDLKDAYADTKRRAEAEVRRLKHYLILRPCFIYGNGDHHGIGRLADFVDSSPVIPLFGGLTATAQPVYIDDFVEMLVRALKNKIEGELTIAGIDRYTLNQILRMITAAKGCRRAFVHVPKVMWATAAHITDQWFPRAGWGLAQMKNIYGSLCHDPEPSIRALGVRPRGLREGFEAWFGGSSGDGA